jgi:glutathione synthase/RimK-type ligase-like ATP-grasp enzyme
MEDEGLLDLIPEYWTDKESIPSEAYPVLCRTILTGHSGAGIHWADTPDDLVDAPLYVKYVKKSEEYRVHVSADGVFLIQRKARRLDHDNPDWRIRNHQNGFIYQRDNVECPGCVVTSAEAAFKATGLDFGAIDVIYNKTKDKAYVLEINTAPGLAGSTVTDYADIIKEMISS